MANYTILKSVILAYLNYPSFTFPPIPAAAKGPFPINTLFALISFTVGALLLGIQVLPLTQKINTLEKEHKIRE